MTCKKTCGLDVISAFIKMFLGSFKGFKVFSFLFSVFIWGENFTFCTLDQ